MTSQNWDSPPRSVFGDWRETPRGSGAAYRHGMVAGRRTDTIIHPGTCIPYFCISVNDVSNLGCQDESAGALLDGVDLHSLETAAAGLPNFESSRGKT